MIEYSEQIPLAFNKKGKLEYEYRAGIIIDELIGIHQIKDDDDIDGVWFELIAIKSGRRICTIDFIDHAILCANALIKSDVATNWISQDKGKDLIPPANENKETIKNIIQIYQDMDNNRSSSLNTKSERSKRLSDKIKELLQQLEWELQDLLED